MRSLGIVGIAAVLCGCAIQPQKLSDEERKKISAVRINGSTVKKTSDVSLYIPPAVVLGGLFGALGAVGDIAVESTKEDAREQARKSLAAVVEKGGVSIEKIVRDEFEHALRDSGKVVIANEDDKSAPVVNITVQRYGFNGTMSGRGEVVPVMKIDCAIVDSFGKKIWNATEELSVPNPPFTPQVVEPVDWDKLREDPQLIEDRWRKGSSYLAKKIVSELLSPNDR